MNCDWDRRGAIAADYGCLTSRYAARATVSRAPQFGYTRYGDVGLKPTGKEIADINGGPLRVAPAGLSGQVHHLRFYDRYLTTTEMVGNFRAGPVRSSTPWITTSSACGSTGIPPC